MVCIYAGLDLQYKNSSWYTSFELQINKLWNIYPFFQKGRRNTRNSKLNRNILIMNYVHNISWYL